MRLIVSSVSKGYPTEGEKEKEPINGKQGVCVCV